MVNSNTKLALARLSDPKFYLENYTKIKGKETGALIPFKLKEAQKDLYNTLKRHNRIIILKARQIGFCADPDTKVLTADLRWAKIKDLKEGDEVVGIDEFAKMTFKRCRRKIKRAVVEKINQVEEESYKIYLSDGRELIFTGMHRLLKKKVGTTDDVWEYVERLKVGDVLCSLFTPWKTDEDLADFLKVAEENGSLRRSKNSVKLHFLNTGLLGSDVLLRMSDKSEVKLTRWSVYHGDFSGNFSIKGIHDVLRMMVASGYECKERKDWWEGVGIDLNSQQHLVEIVKIEKIGKKKMVDVQTSAHTYIADGLISHNSTAVVGYFYHNTITTPGTHTAIIGYDAALTSELLEKVKTFYRSTPAELRPTLQYNSRSEITFPKIDSKIIVLASTANVGRGYTFNNILCTELAFWENPDVKMAALTSTVAPGGGKIVIESCVTGDTIIFTDKGLFKVQDIHDWDDNETGFSSGDTINIDGHYGLQPTNTYYNSGTKKGFRITTKHSYEVGMSSVHKMFVLRNGKLEFVESKDLVLGDTMVIKKGQELWGNTDDVKWIPTPYGFNKGFLELFNTNSISEDLAYLIGLILGDGYVDYKQGRVVITTIDEDVYNFLESHPFGLKFIQSKGGDKFHYILKNSSFVEFLDKVIKFKHEKAPKKEIPDCVLTWRRKNVVAFLQGLFDADGCCDSTRGRVSFVSTSKKIVDVLRILLLNFGIVSSTYDHLSAPTEKVKIWSKSKVIELSPHNSNLFLDKIGFRIKRKQNNRRSDKKFILQENIPGIGKIIKENIKELGLSISSLSGGLNKGIYSKSGTMTYSTIYKILDLCKNKDSEIYKEIKALADKKYFYDTVVEIKEIEEPVYDFTVDNGHTVTYSGFVGHQTPNGMGNLYHQMFMKKNNGYVKKEYGWWWGYTQEEIDFIRMQMDERMFAQEYGLEFLASGRNVFDQNVVKSLRKNILNVGDRVKLKGGGEFIVREEDGWVIYKPVESDGIYVCGVDVAEGVTGGDYSVATIWDRKTGEEVAFYRGYIPPDVFGSKLNTWGRKYNNALMVVEVNNHGLTVLTRLRDLIYPSLYFRPAKFETLITRSSDKFGWKTTKMTRETLIDDLAQAMREKDLLVHTEEILNEMTVMVYDDGGNMVVPASFHDDCLKKGTLIKTINGYKEIEKIKPGDLVLTHKGRYKKVENCLKKPFSGEWYEINSSGQLNIGLSYNHPILVAMGKYKGKELVDYSKRQWKFPGEILKSYKTISIVEPNETIEANKIVGVDNSWGKLQSKKIEIVLNKNFAKFLGLFLAEGHCLKNSNQMSLAFNEKDVDLSLEMREYLESLNINVLEKYFKKTHCRVLYFTSKTLSGALKSCYDEKKEKQFPPFYYKLGYDLKYVLEYWLKGDGWKDKKGVYDIIGATTSKKLALNMRDIAWMVGYYALIHKVKRHRYDVTNKDQFYVSIKYHKNNEQHLKKLSINEYGGKIHSINKTYYTGTVYNLQVEDDRSFMAEGIVVHNCIFSTGIALQGFKSMYTGQLTQLDTAKYLPSNFTY